MIILKTHKPPQLEFRIIKGKFFRFQYRKLYGMYNGKKTKWYNL